MKSRHLLNHYRQKTKFMSLHEFGGALLKKSHPKTARPISKQKTLHFVLSVRDPKWARNVMNYQNQRKMLRLLKNLARRFEIKWQGCRFDHGHIQILCRTKSRKRLNSFLRSSTGLIARSITGAQKGIKNKGKRFFAQRPFSRILEGKVSIPAMSEKQLAILSDCQLIPRINYWSSA